MLSPTALEKRITILYLPFLIASIAVCLSYTFLNWLLIIDLKLLSVKEFILQFIAPFILTALITLFYFKRRIKILNLKRKEGDLPGLYFLIVWIGLSIPCVIAQIYLPKATGKLINLKSINDINKQPSTKYYSILNSYFDKENSGMKPFFETSGKYNERFNMSINISVPILESEHEINHSKCLGFLGLRYSKSIRNRLSPQEKENSYIEFEKISKISFQHENLHEFQYLEVEGNTENHDHSLDASKLSSKYSGKNTPVFIAQKEPFDNRLGNQLNWIFISFGISASVWLIFILIPKLDDQALKKFESGVSPQKMKPKELILVLKPQKTFFITQITIYLGSAEKPYTY